MAEITSRMYWNVNMPANEHTQECPDFLAMVDDDDKKQLSKEDKEYQLMSWPLVKDLINRNQLQCFKRVPSDLRRYRKFMADVKQSHGSVMNYILKERVRWQDLTPCAGPFENKVDIRILKNDWPYGIDPRIVHLVVWVKFDLEEDPTTGDLMPQSRQQVDSYVRQTFKRDENPDHVLWFKNWAALKSVHAVEHFHVMLYDPDLKMIDDLTDGDMALTTQTVVMR